MALVELHFNTALLRPYSKRHGIQKEVEAFNQLLGRNDMDHVAQKLDELLKLLNARLPQYQATLISMLEVEYQRKKSTTDTAVDPEVKSERSCECRDNAV